LHAEGQTKPAGALVPSRAAQILADASRRLQFTFVELNAAVERNRLHVCGESIVNTAAYIVVVVGRDGAVVHNPQHPEMCGAYPWDWCWNNDDRLRWREAFVEACMFRRPQADVPVSLRINDRLFDYRTWLEPAGDDLVICRMVRCFPQVLSSQERAVLSLVAGGESNAEIAKALQIKSATVRSHIASMRRKLHVRRPEGLLLAALQMGIPANGQSGDKTQTTLRARTHTSD
jgi:DNA-binding CsgD family transcriptional regulator